MKLYRKCLVKKVIITATSIMMLLTFIGCGQNALYDGTSSKNNLEENKKYEITAIYLYLKEETDEKTENTEYVPTLCYTIQDGDKTYMGYDPGKGSILTVKKNTYMKKAGKEYLTVTKSMAKFC